jgi:uncharacterized surface protein with fasciclin (FAS1) repeats
MHMLTRRSASLAIVGMATLAMAACSSGSGSSSTPTAVAKPTHAAPLVAGVGGASLVGPGCAAYAAKVPTGAGSVEGMTQDPMATALSHNPMTTALTKAISGKLNPQVRLTQTLNGQDLTLFAPVDSAFQKLPAKTLADLKKNPADLVNLLTYHVVAAQLPPDRVIGTQTTVEGGKLKITGSGNSLKVNGAHVICGGVKTANATVYLIDSVLSPTKK